MTDTECPGRAGAVPRSGLRVPRSADLLVIGAGPGGYPAAFHAADLGLRVVLVDPEANPGGVCLYRGCVPSKALLHVAGFLGEAHEARRWGISLGDPEVDIDKLRHWKDSVVASLTGGLGHLLKQRGIEFVRGMAQLADAHHATVRTHGGEERTLAFQHAIIATGSLSSTIPGLPDSKRIVTSRQALEVRDVPERLLVVGAGYIGLEMGQVYAALGSKVTVVEMQPEILPGADRDLVRFLAQRLEHQFEGLLTETTVKQMAEKDDGIRVEFAGRNAGQKVFDTVMVAIGRKPRTDGVGLDRTGIRLTRDGFIAVDEQQRTAEPSLFAVGDVAGQPMLAHKATYEARVAADAVAGKSTIRDPRCVPAVVFTNPEVAWCGWTEADAEKQGRHVSITRFPWAASGRAATISRRDGMTKLVCDRDNGRILGAGIVGTGAGELIGEAALAVEMGAVAEDLALTIHPHPTLSETIMEAAQAFSGSSTHFLGTVNRRGGPR